MKMLEENKKTRQICGKKKEEEEEEEEEEEGEEEEEAANREREKIIEIFRPSKQMNVWPAGTNNESLQQLH